MGTGESDLFSLLRHSPEREHPIFYDALRAVPDAELLW